MVDSMTPEQRQRCMSSIRSKDTRPELAVRRWLWAHGYRYRLNVGSVPGKPDIVMRRYRTAIFVNGCFWHGHGLADTGEGGEMADSACCRVPRSNREFWLGKLRRNRERDEHTWSLLRENGWQVVVVWECQLKPASRMEATMRRVELMLNERLLDSFRPAAPRPYPTN